MTCPPTCTVLHWCPAILGARQTEEGSEVTPQQTPSESPPNQTGSADLQSRRSIHDTRGLTDTKEAWGQTAKGPPQDNFHKQSESTGSPAWLETGAERGPQMLTLRVSRLACYVPKGPAGPLLDGLGEAQGCGFSCPPRL